MDIKKKICKNAKLGRRFDQGKFTKVIACMLRDPCLNDMFHCDICADPYDHACVKYTLKAKTIKK